MTDTTGKACESRIVSFDLMPQDPDFYFVLTEALQDFEARQRGEAEDLEGDDATARIRWAETAELALARIEEALATRPGGDGQGDDEDEEDLVAYCTTCRSRVGIFLDEHRQDDGSQPWEHYRGQGTLDDPVDIYTADHDANVAWRHPAGAR